MSSGFVSAGQDSDWVRAQQEVEERTRAKNAEGKQHDGKSLYEVLQQNKAAKQDAFEESIKLKNQFRTLDDDEVEFLDSVLESTRTKEAAVKKDTAEQLEAFRKQQEAAEKSRFDEPVEGRAPDSARSPLPEDTWATKKRRRREKAPEPVIGAKVRRLSSKGDGTSSASTRPSTEDTRAKELVDSRADPEKKANDAVTAKAASASDSSSKSAGKTTGTSLLGLGDYSSDDD